MKNSSNIVFSVFLVLLAGFGLALVAWQPIQGTTYPPGPITPTPPPRYPTSTNIPPARRAAWMICEIVQTNYWQLQPDLITWKQLPVE